MFDSPTVSSPLLAVYGPWLIGGIAGLVTFFVTAAIMGIVLRRRDRIRLERSRRPLPGTIQPIQPMPLEPMRSQVASKRAPHIGWLLILLAAVLVGAVLVVLWTPQAKGDGIQGWQSRVGSFRPDFNVREWDTNTPTPTPRECRPQTPKSR